VRWPPFTGPTPDEVRDTAARAEEWLDQEMARTGETREEATDRAIRSYITGAIKRQQLGEEPHEGDEMLLRPPDGFAPGAREAGPPP